MEIKDKVVTSALNYPEHDANGRSIKVLDTYTNLEWLLDHFKIKVRYNRMSRRREVTIPQYQTDKDHEANNQITYIKRLCTLNYLSNKNVDEHLDIIAANNAYHPIVDSMPKWDGVDRLYGSTGFYNTIKAQDHGLARKLLSTWMRAAIAAAHSIDGFTNHGVLVLQGKQGIGLVLCGGR